ncbi:MAG: hypothetical protein KDN18_10560, partial [Verrucomicrobiae bacterium]|nr:hypothetical protein [Verrucomicrobiae bacterium]
SGIRLAFFRRRSGNVTAMLMTGRLVLESPVSPSRSQFELRSRHTGTGFRTMAIIAAAAEAESSPGKDKVRLKLLVR